MASSPSSSPPRLSTEKDRRTLPLNNSSLAPDYSQSHLYPYQGGPNSPSSSSSFPDSDKNPTTRLAAFSSLIVFATFSSRGIPFVAVQNLNFIAWITVLHFGLLSLAGVGFGWLNPRSRFAGGKFWLIRRGEDDGKRLAALIAGLSIVSWGLGFAQARLLDSKVWQAIEVLLIPTLLLLSPLLSPLPSRVSNPVVTFGGAITFAVGMCLIGVPATFLGLVVAVCRVAIEGYRWHLLKSAMGGERAGSVLLMTTVATFGVSISLLILTGLLTSELPSISPDQFDVLRALYFTFASVLSTISLLFTLQLFGSPLTSAWSTLPRNLLLLLAQILERNGLPITGNWAQLLLVTMSGTLGLFWTDSELRATISEPTSWLTKRLPLRRESFTESSTAPRNRSNSPPSANSSHSKPRNSNLNSPSVSIGFLLLPFLPLALYLLSIGIHTSPTLSTFCTHLPYPMRPFCPSSALPIPQTIDIVFAYYDESLDIFRQHLENVRYMDFMEERGGARVLVYNKGPRSEKEIREALRLWKEDLVIPLENVGREGGTYLRHILDHYNGSLPRLPSSASRPNKEIVSPRMLADHTLFMQPHLAWESIAGPRLKLIGAETGFGHFGPMVLSNCGKDAGEAGTYPLVKEFFSMFVGEVCSPKGFLTAWSAQFVVSKRRILANPYSRYLTLSNLLSAPEGHFIHDTWGPNGSGGPSNPAAGHSVERAWPLIFGCSDPGMLDRCPNEIAVREKCQCLDLN